MNTPDSVFQECEDRLSALRTENAALQSIIDEARKLAAKWRRENPTMGAPGVTHLVLPCADELEAVLDRSGARGGSVAENPASSPDNPPTNEDRSRT